MLRANRDATRQKDPKGFVVQTSSNEICRQFLEDEDGQLRAKNIYSKKSKKSLKI